MSKKRVAIACQGGGSQCAFVAGALGGLFAQGVQDRYKVVGLSGTSGGAFTAALAWAGLLRQSQGDKTPIEDGILACWRDLTAQTPLEMFVDGFGVQLLRLTERGVLPSYAISPSSVRFQAWSAATSRAIMRPEFTDLRALLVKHIDFEHLPSADSPESPALLVGAVDILEGSFKTFSSRLNEISVEALLASAAIPNLFPAVHVDGHAYWDGIFSSNPPILSFLRRAHVGRGLLPQEIWIIQVNRSSYDFVPEYPSDIFDRRNQLAGNLSLHHELQFVELANMLLAHNALSEDFRLRFGLDLTEPIQVRFIRMSRKLQDSLDYPSKLSRQPGHIESLIADGKAQARAFLSENA
jgi:NTE family protein